MNVVEDKVTGRRSLQLTTRSIVTMNPEFDEAEALLNHFSDNLIQLTSPPFFYGKIISEKKLTFPANSAENIFLKTFINLTLLQKLIHCVLQAWQDCINC